MLATSRLQEKPSQALTPSSSITALGHTKENKTSLAHVEHTYQRYISCIDAPKTTQAHALSISMLHASALSSIYVQYPNFYTLNMRPLHSYALSFVTHMAYIKPCVYTLPLHLLYVPALGLKAYKPPPFLAITSRVTSWNVFFL